MGRRILCLIVYSLCRDIGLNVYDLSLILRSRAGVVKGNAKIHAGKASRQVHTLPRREAAGSKNRTGLLTVAAQVLRNITLCDFNKANVVACVTIVFFNCLTHAFCLIRAHPSLSIFLVTPENIGVVVYRQSPVTPYTEHAGTVLPTRSSDYDSMRRRHQTIPSLASIQGILI